MNQHEQLKRMRALHKDAVRLKDAIKDEINEILDDIAERRKFADECDERAKQSNRTWDGKQPDFWYEAGHIWMKATDNHRGQSVLVAKDRQGMRPLDCFEAERIAKLGKVTEFGDYACYNSDETKIQHWPIAWAPCTQEEVDQYQGGKFVSVVLADKMKLVKKASKDNPEQVDPLLDDPFDHVPDVPQKWPTFSEILDSPKWIPKVGDRVRVNCPGRIAHGKIGVVVEEDAGEYEVRIVGENFKSCNLKAEHLELIENADPSEVPNSSIPDPGPGYRLLSKEPPERLLDTDEGFFANGRDGGQWLSVNYSGGDQLPLVYYRRKIEEPAKAQEPQYRKPTQSDLANGPIDVEVCDDTNCDLNWEKRQLYAILPSKCMFPYIVGAPGREELTQSWKHARIKVDC